MIPASLVIRRVASDCRSDSLWWQSIVLGSHSHFSTCFLVLTVLSPLLYGLQSLFLVSRSSMRPCVLTLSVWSLCETSQFECQRLVLEVASDALVLDRRRDTLALFHQKKQAQWVANCLVFRLWLHTSWVFMKTIVWRLHSAAQDVSSSDRCDSSWGVV